MEIFYQDNDIVVCKKEYGISSQASGGENMLDIIRDTLGLEAYAVHRLDVTTSGVMVYALNRQSASALCAQVANRTLEKTYLAIVHGEAPTGERLCDYLFHDKRVNKSFIVGKERAGVKEAILSYERLGTATLFDMSVSLLKIKLETGRTHQIRAQLSHRQMSLLGDKKYGARDACRQIALYSYSIKFVHPKTKKEMEFRCEPSDPVYLELLKAMSN